VLIGVAVAMGLAPAASAARPCEGDEIKDTTVAAEQQLPGDKRWWPL
jgi:hypothetical protein